MYLLQRFAITNRQICVVQIEGVLQLCRQHNLICVLEVHDSTGYPQKSEAEHPDNAVDYWLSSDVRAAIDGHEYYVIVNIANEPFGNTDGATGVPCTPHTHE